MNETTVEEVQEMAVVQQTSAKWKIVQVLGEAEQKPTTVSVYAAKIDPKIANSLIRELNSKTPLTSLGHVKRVQRSIKEGTFELSIILCKVDRVKLGEEIDLPAVVSEIVDRYCLQPFMATVAEHPARSREEWEMQCQLWPTSFHPNSGKSAANSELSQTDVETMCYFMEIAVEQARLARQHGHLANGAIIVDPALGAVIARGHDGTARWCESLGCQSHGSIECQDRTASETNLSYRWHPLQHAVMEAIQMVAERDKQLWPSEDLSAMDNNSGVNDCSIVVSHKRQRSSEDIRVGNTSADTSFLPQDPETLGATSSFETARPYLCTDCDLYVTREPCAMCAMAMVHQRIRRVIYGIPNALVGALGSRYKLHCLPSLNHHYTVFHMSLSEADLS